MWKIIIPVILIIICCTATVVILRRRRSMQAARAAAASVLLRESQLNNAISRESGHDHGRSRFVLELSWKDSAKRKYLFDPSVPVRIGRDPEKNQVCIRRDVVSSEHCLLVMYKGALTVQDLNSSNGTFIRRKHSRYRVNGRVYLKNGDRLEIGGICFRVEVFFFDAAYI